MSSTKIIHSIPCDPLTGAGREVTDRGVLSDILKLSTNLN